VALAGGGSGFDSSPSPGDEQPGSPVSTRPSPSSSTEFEHAVVLAVDAGPCARPTPATIAAAKTAKATMSDNFLPMLS
jgi:hypothetical protein